MTPDDDVFISYHWRDREGVESVAIALRERGLSGFLDRWYLVPGRPWHPVRYMVYGIPRVIVPGMRGG